MVLAVVSDQMSILFHLPDDLLVAVNILSDEEKCGRHASFLKALQKA
jgi:hypothetical protein